jgi:hypothetical protein
VFRRGGREDVVRVGVVGVGVGESVCKRERDCVCERVGM